MSCWFLSSSSDCDFISKVRWCCDGSCFLLNSWMCCLRIDTDCSLSLILIAETLLLSCSDETTWQSASTWFINAVDESEDCLGENANISPDFVMLSITWEIKDIQVDCTSHVKESSDNDNVLRRGLKCEPELWIKDSIKPLLKQKMWCELTVIANSSRGSTLVPEIFLLTLAIFALKESYIGWNGSKWDIFSKTNLNFCCFFTQSISSTNFESSVPSTGFDQCLHRIILSRSAPSHVINFFHWLHDCKLGRITKISCDGSIRYPNHSLGCLRELLKGGISHWNKVHTLHIHYHSQIEPMITTLRLCSILINYIKHIFDRMQNFFIMSTREIPV